MPLGDWQFWVVTLAAIAGLVFAVRTILPRRKKSGTRVDLTVDRQSVSRNSDQ